MCNRAFHFLNLHVRCFLNVCVCIYPQKKQNGKIPCRHCYSCYREFSFALLHDFRGRCILNPIVLERSIDICARYSVLGFLLHTKLFRLL